MEKLLSAGMTYLKLLKPEVSFFFRAEEADNHLARSRRWLSSDNGSHGS